MISGGSCSGCSGPRPRCCCSPCPPTTPRSSIRTSTRSSRKARGPEGKTAEELLLRPFLRSLSSHASSFRCVALLLFRFLLQSGGEQAREADGRSDQRPRQQPERIKIVGYDARVRHAYKCLAVAVLSHWDESSTNEEAGASESSARATRKFEALEDAVVSRLAAQPERDPSCR